MEDHTPQSINILNAALASLGLNPEKVAALGITNVQIVSPRSIRFDLPDKVIAPGDTETRNINRVKVTARENNTIDVRFIEIVEHELVGGVEPGNLGAVIEKFTGLKLS